MDKIVLSPKCQDQLKDSLDTIFDREIFGSNFSSIRQIHGTPNIDDIIRNTISE